jgi:hypothetical protein
MKITLRTTAIALAGMTLGLAAQAQHARVVSDNPEKARAVMDASMRAAARGQKVGMISGRLNPQPERLANGAVVQELDAGTMMYSVARVNADGKLEMVCVDGAEAAQKAMKAPVFAKRVSQNSKEQSHVK